jgi:pSer/pThr/pTyr-binding forkhead associated (FHA) protein
LERRGRPTVVVVHCPDGTAVGQTWPLDSDAPVGREVGTANGITLQDKGLSRHHATFEVHGRRVRVRDEGSTNGVFVDGQKVAEEALQEGALIRLGRSLLGFGYGLAALGAPDITGVSQALREAVEAADRIAATQASVLILGETGTGKEPETA